MKIEQVALREIHMQLKSPFETSFGVTRKRRILLVEVIADGTSGWGEVTSTETPSYNSETTDTAWHIIVDHLAPSIVGMDLAGATELPALWARIRGHEMAKAGVENALWDAEAQQKGVPLAKLIGGTRQQIPCGVSLGICQTSQLLVKRVEEELRSGYQRIKLKIKPGKDVEFVAALNACRIINVKLGRVGGHGSARQVHDVCRGCAVPVWCGGMLESGIGRAHNIAMSTQPGFTLPGDVSASKRYWDEDIIEPEVEVVPDGTIQAPTGPGLGFAVKRDLVERLTSRSKSWKRGAAASVQSNVEPAILGQTRRLQDVPK